MDLPTGAGKSIIIAEFCRQSLEWWDDTRILVLTHQKELIEQDARKLLDIWPEAKIGLYSASLKIKDLSMPITFASIQSIGKKKVMPFDIILIDEAHLINNEETGLYRKFLSSMINSRIIGLTATPFRLGQGLLTEGKNALFTDIIQPVSILELQRDGYLAILRSKTTFTKIDVSDVHVRGGEYIESELQEKVNVYTSNVAIVDEIIKSAAYYKRSHWLIFCAGVEHAQTICNLMQDAGIKAGCVTSKMEIWEREDMLDAFKQGKLTALTNANILTTGFDYPDIDLIAMLRPTKSPGLYMQMAGRGLRLKSQGGDCLVLDFAGNVETHGPIAYIKPPKAKTENGSGVVPMKECPECLEIVPASIRICPSCGYEFPKEDKTWMLFDGDINGDGIQRWTITTAIWSKTESRTSGKPMLTCTYWTKESEYKQFTEFYLLWHNGYAQKKSKNELRNICYKSNIEYTEEDNFNILIDKLKSAKFPMFIFTQKHGKYDRIVNKLYEDDVKTLVIQKEKRERTLNEAKSKIFAGLLANNPKN